MSLLFSFKHVRAWRKGVRHKLEYFLTASLSAVVGWLPLSWVHRLGKVLGWIAFYFVPVRKSVALENLERAFPEKSVAEQKMILKRTYQRLITSMLEFFCFDRMKEEQIWGMVEVANLSVAERALEKEKGIVLLSGHFGNWELNALVGGRILGKPLHIVVKERRNQYIEAMLRKRRCLWGNKIVIERVAYRAALKTLKEDGIVALLGDQCAPKQGIMINFFGTPAATFRGPAALALKCGSPLLMSFILYDRGKYKIVFEEVATEGLERTEEGVRELTERHVKMLERYIKDHPDHWFWFHKRWKRMSA